MVHASCSDFFWFQLSWESAECTGKSRSRPAIEDASHIFQQTVRRVKTGGVFLITHSASPFAPGFAKPVGKGLGLFVKHPKGLNLLPVNHLTTRHINFGITNGSQTVLGWDKFAHQPGSDEKAY